MSAVDVVESGHQPMSRVRSIEERQRTFYANNWPANRDYIYRLAEAGFVFDGTCLRCEGCGVVVDDSHDVDEVYARHEEEGRNCRFLSKLREVRRNSTVDSPQSREHTETRRGDRIDGPILLTNKIRAQRTKNKLLIEQERLNTFTSWPVDFISPQELANTGFYYLGEGDKVQCIFCHGIMGAWERGDIPAQEHRRHYPDCPFLRGVDTGNVPITGTTVSAASNQPGIDVCGRSELIFRPNSRPENATGGLGSSVNTKQGASYEELGITKHSSPRHPNYSTYDSRMRTFLNWSPILPQKPENLARAGFFYLGAGDQVRCFHCDGGLNNWEPNDDPWTEHARWYPDCSFLNLIRGDGFIKEAKNKPQSTVNQQPATPNRSMIVKNFTETEAETLLSSQPASEALNLGIDRGLVKAAICRRVRETGLPFSSIDSLLEAVFSLSNENQSRIDVEMPEYREEPSSEHRIMRPPQSPPNIEVMETTYEPSTNISDDDTGSHDDGYLSQKSQDSDTERVSPTPGLQVTPPKDDNNKKDHKLCKICWDQEMSVVFLPCGHLLACTECATQVPNCPICRKPIKGTVRAFIS